MEAADSQHELAWYECLMIKIIKTGHHGEKTSAPIVVIQ